jgi:lysozyme
MTALDLAMELVRRFEGCRLRAYRDVAGVWTIGWGETAGVRAGMTWTQAQADAILRRRVAHFMLGVLRRCPALHAAGPERLAACTSLAYNIGLGAFGASSVCRKAGRGDHRGAADSFLLWNKAGGRVWRGLVRRREAERALYLQQV